MAEQKRGLFKRIFSFGFGKKENVGTVEPEADNRVVAADPPAIAEAAETVVPAPKPESVPIPPAAQPQTPPTPIDDGEREAAEEPEAAPAAAADERPGIEAEADVEVEETLPPAARPQPVAPSEVPETPAETGRAKAPDDDQTEAARKSEPEPAGDCVPASEVVTPQSDSTKFDPPQSDPPQSDLPPSDPPASLGSVALTERERRQAEPQPDLEAERKANWLKRLSGGLSRSSTTLKDNITQVFTDRKLDDDTLQDLEDVLIRADLGVDTAMRITETLAEQKFGKTVSEREVREVMAEAIEEILEPVALDLDLDLDHQPHVILVIGVNGSGKTTTIGKLASKLYDAGFSTTLVAGDTFRAAAIEQLKIWGERTSSPVLFRPIGADAAALVYDAWQQAREERRDVLLIDTAGRLQNKAELMAELEKIVRVLKKQDPSAPHTVLLTLDATTGQNALSQVEIFKDVASVNGLVMTKLDGTARGGILVAIAAKHKLPVYFAGVGEQVADLEPFEARAFARSIAGLPTEEPAAVEPK